MSSSGESLLPSFLVSLLLYLSKNDLYVTWLNSPLCHQWINYFHIVVSFSGMVLFCCASSVLISIVSSAASSLWLICCLCKCSCCCSYSCSCVGCSSYIIWLSISRLKEATMICIPLCLLISHFFLISLLRVLLHIRLFFFAFVAISCLNLSTSSQFWYCCI